MVGYIFPILNSLDLAKQTVQEDKVVRQIMDDSKRVTSV